MTCRAVFMTGPLCAQTSWDQLGRRFPVVVLPQEALFPGGTAAFLLASFKHVKEECRE